MQFKRRVVLNPGFESRIESEPERAAGAGFGQKRVVRDSASHTQPWGDDDDDDDDGPGGGGRRRQTSSHGSHASFLVDPPRDRPIRGRAARRVVVVVVAVGDDDPHVPKPPRAPRRRRRASAHETHRVDRHARGGRFYRGSGRRVEGRRRLRRRPPGRGGRVRRRRLGQEQRRRRPSLPVGRRRHRGHRHLSQPRGVRDRRRRGCELIADPSGRPRADHGGHAHPHRSHVDIAQTEGSVLGAVKRGVARFALRRRVPDRVSAAGADVDVAGYSGGQQRRRGGDLLRRPARDASRRRPEKTRLFARRIELGDEGGKDMRGVHEGRSEQLPREPGSVPGARGVRRARGGRLHAGQHASRGGRAHRG